MTSYSFNLDLLSLRFFGLVMFILGIFLASTPIGGALCVCGGLSTCTSFVIKEVRLLRENLETQEATRLTKYELH